MSCLASSGREIVTQHVYFSDYDLGLIDVVNSISSTEGIFKDGNSGLW